MAFRKLGIGEPILKAIEEAKFEKPSEIQEKAIPLTLEGKDVIAGSATGSGKTLAFGVSIIQNCVKGKGIQSLVLTPTRELAEQIRKELNKFSKHNPLNIISIYGGVSINPQIDALPHSDVVIGTPGRILDHLERRTLDLSQVNILVLDEADRMLDMGFIDDVKRIITQCKKQRQTLLFSATMAPEITDIAQRFMNDPAEVSVESYVDPSKLHQEYFGVSDNQKFSLLVHLLKGEHAGLIMVFCNTQHNTDFVARNLQKLGIDATATHGGFSQAKRNQALEKFNGLKVSVLVCTDVAARGLDIKGVSHVYNYDIPKESKQYIHRIGRTARAGEKGKAINILSQRDHDNFSRILRDFDVNIEKREIPDDIERVQIKWKPEGRGRRGGFGGQRRSNSSGRRGGFGGRRSNSEGRGRSGGSGSRGGFGGQRRSGSSGSREDSGSRGGFGGQRRSGGSGSRGGAGRSNSGSRESSGSGTFGPKKSTGNTRRGGFGSAGSRR